MWKVDVNEIAAQRRASRGRRIENKGDPWMVKHLFAGWSLESCGSMLILSPLAPFCFPRPLLLPFYQSSLKEKRSTSTTSANNNNNNNKVVVCSWLSRFRSYVCSAFHIKNPHWQQRSSTKAKQKRITIYWEHTATERGVSLCENHFSVNKNVRHTFRKAEKTETKVALKLSPAYHINTNRQHMIVRSILTTDSSTRATATRKERILRGNRFWQQRQND